MAKSKAKIRAVEKELLGLGRAKKRHLEYAAAYTEMLLRSLTKPEQREVFKRMLKHGVDMYGIEARKLVPIKIERLKMQVRGLDRRLRGISVRYALQPSARLHREYLKLVRRRNSIASRIERLEYAYGRAA